MLKIITEFLRAEVIYKLTDIGTIICVAAAAAGQDKSSPRYILLKRWNTK